MSPWASLPTTGQLCRRSLNGAPQPAPGARWRRVRCGDDRQRLRRWWRPGPASPALLYAGRSESDEPDLGRLQSAASADRRQAGSVRRTVRPLPMPVAPRRLTAVAAPTSARSGRAEPGEAAPTPAAKDRRSRSIGSGTRARFRVEGEPAPDPSMGCRTSAAVRRAGDRPRWEPSRPRSYSGALTDCHGLGGHPSVAMNCRALDVIAW